MTRTRDERAAVHHALGDVHRLEIVDALWLSDRTPTELRKVTGLSSNLLAFHLGVLEEAGVIDRHPSQGDRRRRYVSLSAAAVQDAPPGRELVADPVLFVCTHNSARSQLAASLWMARTGRTALSAGTDPAADVHPLAVDVAAAHGLDVSAMRPQPYEAVEVTPSLVVSVCDRARETALPFDAPLLHWSVPDPAGGGRDHFEMAFSLIRRRVERLASQVAA